MSQLNESEAIFVRDTLRDAMDYFVNRDEMNAKVHLDEIRYSPITEKVSSAWNLMLSRVYMDD